MTYAATDVATTHEWSTGVSISKSASHWTETVLSGDLSQWKDSAVTAVLRLSRLSDNWDGYASPQPSKQVVDASIDLIKAILFDDLPSPQIVPVAGGGIQFEWSVSQRELQFEIRPDSSIEFLKAVRGEPVGEGKVEDIYQLQAHLAWLIST